MEERQMKLRRALSKYNRARAMEKMLADRKGVLRANIILELESRGGKYEDDDWNAYIESLGGDEIITKTIIMDFMFGPHFSRKDYIEMIECGALVVNTSKYLKYASSRGFEDKDVYKESTSVMEKTQRLQVKAKGPGRVCEKEKNKIKMV